MGLRGENIPDRKSKVPYGQNPIRKREKRKAAGKKAIKQSDRAANKLRIAKEWLKNPKSLNKSERNILDNLINSLGKKYGKKEGYQSLQTLRNWVDNKGGIRNKALLGIGDEALGFPKSLKRKRTALQKVEDKRAAETAQRAASPSAQIQDEPPKESSPTKKVAKVVPRIVDTGIAFGPRTEKKKISASPIGTVDPGAKSKASAPTRRGDERITINPKDTLSDLAKDRGTTLAAIRRANPGRFPTAKSLNIIKAGEKINMPPNVGATTPYDTKTVRVKPKVVPTPKRKPKQGRTAQDETARISITGGETPFSQSKQKKKKTTETQKPGLMPWNWKRTDTTGPTDSAPGKREYETLFGKVTLGEDPEETARKEREYEEMTQRKKGGRIKKGVKKTKTKARRRAALRGHRAELRGG